MLDWLRDQTQETDFLGPLLAGIGAFPFVPNKMGQYLKDLQTIHGLKGSRVPLYHGTDVAFEGLPDFLPDPRMTNRDVKTTYGAFNPAISKAYAGPAYEPQFMDLADIYPRILEQSVDFSNVGYAPWKYGSFGEMLDRKPRIFEDMISQGRSGVILDPGGKFDPGELPEMDSTYKAIINKDMKAKDVIEKLISEGYRDRPYGPTFAMDPQLGFDLANNRQRSDFLVPDWDENLTAHKGGNTLDELLDIYSKKLETTFTPYAESHFSNEKVSPQVVLWDKNIGRDLIRELIMGDFDKQNMFLPEGF